MPESLQSYQPSSKTPTPNKNNDKDCDTTNGHLTHSAQLKSPTLSSSRSRRKCIATKRYIAEIDQQFTDTSQSELIELQNGNK